MHATPLVSLIVHICCGCDPRKFHGAHVHRISLPFVPVDFHCVWDADLGCDANHDMQGNLATCCRVVWFSTLQTIILLEPLQAIDLWSVGCIHFECVARTVLFPGHCRRIAEQGRFADIVEGTV